MLFFGVFILPISFSLIAGLAPCGTAKMLCVYALVVDYKRRRNSDINLSFLLSNKVG